MRFPFGPRPRRRRRPDSTAQQSITTSTNLAVGNAAISAGEGVGMEAAKTAPQPYKGIAQNTVSLSAAQQRMALVRAQRGRKKQ